ncbi:hypothetical protein [Candidatus Absconditicoccus praedator]|uniref:hypothetical protein n=1 Tax=Candidatus Absconditicoccus praedator TaxID=2735562 RepID=UPI001E3A191D|nr:hypothetical protein [Candidatus Absconditicoccus praedator]UFX82844.1 hypothetical protein HLG78_01765 [Candidatus Absconditicoccus praedator]
MRKIFVFLSIIFIVLSSSLSFVRAEDNSSQPPGVCFNTTDEVQLFVSSISGFLRNVDLDQDDSLKSQALSVPGGVISALLNSVVSMGVGMINFTELIQILMADEPVFRDFRKIYELEMHVSDFLHQVGFSGIAFANVDDDTISLFNDYFNNEDLYIRYYIKDDINYFELASILHNIYFMGQTVFVDASFERTQPRGFDNGEVSWPDENQPSWNDSVNIIFNEEKYDKLKEDYGNVGDCPSQVGFREQLGGIRDDFKEGGADAMGRIQDDAARLGEALRDAGESMFGEGAAERWRDWGSSAISIETDFEDLEDLENPFSEIDTLPDDCYDEETIPGTNETRRVLKDECRYAGLEESAGDITSDQKIDNFKNNIESVYDSVMLAQDDGVADLNKNMEYIKNITNNIPSLSRNIYNGINIIGERGEENTIIDNLGNACELQCSNLGGICWYF